MRRSRLVWIVAVLVLVGLVDVAPASAQTPPVGTVREWVGLDDFNGTLYRKDYTLRAVGQKVEVWVANDRTFPAGDCRNLPVSTDVTDAQVSTLTTEFDGTIYPTETAVFGTPPDRDGSNAQLAGDFTGDGDKTVLLLDNVRDENFYDRFVPTVIPGFFSAQYNELLDRNVVTIDVFDWTHRSGAGPPDEPTADPCTSRPARPYEKEAELARRWQALGHYYTDPFEGNWIGQGMSELAAALTGYVDPTASVPISCFTGFGVDCGGPENSLNLWNEGDPDADVGHASALMLFLHDRYGDDFITRLHQDGLEQGLEGLDAALEAEGVADMYGVLHDFRTMLLVDGIVGESPAGSMTGIARDRVTTPSLRSTVDLTNPDAYDRVPGAPPNGADFVPLAAPGPRLESVTFEGAETLPTHPLRWTSISNDPDRPGNAVLWSRDGNDIDEMAVIEVTVPVGDPTLRLAAKYGAELGYDYGYVMVSTDGGATYAPVAGDNTVDGPLGPSLNGSTDGFEPHTFGLTAYAGQSILLGFRYISDGGVNEGGILLDDVTVGATQLSDGTNIAAFRSRTEVHPTEVHDWNLRLVGLDESGRAAAQVEVDGEFSATLDRAALRALAPFPEVVAIVSYDEPTELEPQYAPYTLTVTEGDPPPEPPAPPSGSAPQPEVPPPPSAASCRVQGVVLVGIRNTGSRVRLVGIADRSLAGEEVAIRRDGREVGTATVAADGSISAVIRAPRSLRARARARYQLVAAGNRSLVLKATRRARITGQTRLADGRLRVRGVIAGIERPTALRIRSELLCGGTRADADRTIRTDRRGRFTATLSPPATPGQSAIYRIRVRGSRSVTLPVVLTR